MARVSKGKVRYLKRVFALKVFLDSIMLPNGSIDIFKVAARMGTRKRLGGGFDGSRKPQPFKMPQWESFLEVERIAQKVAEDVQNKQG